MQPGETRAVWRFPFGMKDELGFIYKKEGGEIFMEEKIWKVAVYLRLSKEDGKEESLSVGNQRMILKEFLEKEFVGQYELAGCYTDDGLTGTDDRRPAFQQMMADVERGKVNCILCKNLSRMFRNYADQGYFLETFFPLHGVRFVTVSHPKVDSYLHPEELEGLEVPISGLMNDRYAAKTSRDIRATFGAKRRKGEFIGAFAPYGYQKDPQDKNHLVEDEEAARWVRSIFDWFGKEGMSKRGIALRLNQMGVLSPGAYKRSKGMAYHNPHMDHCDGLWSGAAVAAILKNPVYVGTMVQGRQGVVSYKIHKKISLPPPRWYVVPHTHPPLVEEDLFYKVQQLSQRNQRSGTIKGELHTFAGLLRCGGCQKAMHRVTSKGRAYFFCRTYKEKSIHHCTKHTLRQDRLEEMVLGILNQLIKEGVDFERLKKNQAERKRKAPSYADDSKWTLSQYEKVLRRKDGLYEDWKDGVLDWESYQRLKEKYAKQEKTLQEEMEKQREQPAPEIEEEENISFFEEGKLRTLDRGLAVWMLDRIVVEEGGEMQCYVSFRRP